MQLLHHAVTYHYDQYQTDPHYVMSNHAHLFHRPLTTMLQYRRNTLSNWICSVEEAVYTRAHCQQKQANTIKQYFLVVPTSRRKPSVTLPNPTELFRPPFSASYYAKQTLANSTPAQQQQSVRRNTCQSIPKTKHLLPHQRPAPTAKQHLTLQPVHPTQQNPPKQTPFRPVDIAN